MRYYYSRESARGSSTSYGFSNDTIVCVFSSRKARDTYVEESDNLSCRAIYRKDVTREARNPSLTGGGSGAPRPFTGEMWIIDTHSEQLLPKGFVGTIDVGHPSPWDSIPFYDRNGKRTVKEERRRRQ